MKLTRLDITGLRCVQAARIESAAAVRVLVGANGAGKTTVLEAIHLLGYGRSFRSGGRDAVARRGSPESVVFAEVAGERAGVHRVGLQRRNGEWQGRVDEEDVPGLAALFRTCPVTCFEPGSHALISGASEYRRGFLDWSVFHVEPEFLSSWRRHQRALRQRNAGLKAGWRDALLEPWEHELAEAGIQIVSLRERTFAALVPQVVTKADGFLSELGAIRMQLNHGFGDRAIDSAEVLRAIYAEERVGDRERGHTRFGAHRADWSLRFAEAPRRDYLSRGQEKLAALAMMLAQSEHYRLATGEWPILLLDDLASELDQEHLGRVLDWVLHIDAQTWITGTAVPQALSERGAAWQLFHVEQGRVDPA